MKIKNQHFKCLQCRDKGTYKVPLYEKYPNREYTVIEIDLGYWEAYCDCDLGKHLFRIETSGQDEIMLDERMRDCF